MVSGPSGINVPVGDDSGGPVAPAGAPATDVTDAWLAWIPAVLDTLLPANGGLPAAGAMGLAELVLVDATWSPEFAQALQWLDDALPASFAHDDEAARVEALRTLESAQPRTFATIVNLAYNAYYTNATVLHRIEAASGFTARPPQPLGYELEPFDPSIMATISRREPFWRPA